MNESAVSIFPDTEIPVLRLLLLCDTNLSTEIRHTQGPVYLAVPNWVPFPISNGMRQTGNVKSVHCCALEEKAIYCFELQLQNWEAKLMSCTTYTEMPVKLGLVSR